MLVIGDKEQEDGTVSIRRRDCVQNEVMKMEDFVAMVAEEIKESFEESEGFISLTVNHEDLTNIEVCYSDLIGYLSVGMTKEAEVTKNRLVDALKHLRRLSGVNIDSII
jgi:hypothetical protein